MPGAVEHVSGPYEKSPWLTSSLARWCREQSRPNHHAALARPVAVWQAHPKSGSWEHRRSRRISAMDEHPRTPSLRIAGVGVVAFSSIAWWPAFTLGAWGTVFFPQVLSLWAVATAAFVLVAVSGGVRQRVGWGALALLIPTVWLALAIEFAPGSRPELAWFGTLVTLLGAPVMVAILIRFSAPDLAEDATWRDRGAVIAAVAVVVAGAYGIGTIQERIFTCGDFTISGNSQPPGCTPGEPSLELGRR